MTRIEQLLAVLGLTKLGVIIASANCVVASIASLAPIASLASIA